MIKSVSVYFSDSYIRALDILDLQTKFIQTLIALHFEVVCHTLSLALLYVSVFS